MALRIAAFENHDPEPLILIIEPSEQRYEVPQLAVIGIRYVVAEGEEDRTFIDKSGDTIHFWFNAPDHEADIVYPGPYDRLMWALCPGLGFCGGIVGGVLTHVSDLLPNTGIVTADRFAELVLRAESEPEELPRALRRWQAQLAQKFVQHMGASIAPAEALRFNQRRPFDPPESLEGSPVSIIS